mmetsp:Transcript_22054/g.61706  ORF Transcript_22054/g.61706 Transcript_22054/m.61706 type:complete len:336 (+) Transcript_22054:575-1582(+)
MPPGVRLLRRPRPVVGPFAWLSSGPSAVSSCSSRAARWSCAWVTWSSPRPSPSTWHWKGLSSSRLRASLPCPGACGPRARPGDATRVSLILLLTVGFAAGCRDSSRMRCSRSPTSSMAPLPRPSRWPPPPATCSPGAWPCPIASAWSSPWLASTPRFSPCGCRTTSWGRAVEFCLRLRLQRSPPKRRGSQHWATPGASTMWRWTWRSWTSRSRPRRQVALAHRRAGLQGPLHAPPTASSPWRRLGQCRARREPACIKLLAARQRSRARNTLGGRSPVRPCRIRRREAAGGAGAAAAASVCAGVVGGRLETAGSSSAWAWSPSSSPPRARRWRRGC